MNRDDLFYIVALMIVPTGLLYVGLMTASLFRMWRKKR